MHIKCEKGKKFNTGHIFLRTADHSDYREIYHKFMIMRRNSGCVRVISGLEMLVTDTLICFRASFGKFSTYCASA